MNIKKHFNFHKKNTNIVLKAFNRYRLIYTIILMLTGLFLSLTGYGVLVLFITSVMLLNLYLAWFIIVKPINKNNEED